MILISRGGIWSLDRCDVILGITRVYFNFVDIDSIAVGQPDAKYFRFDGKEGDPIIRRDLLILPNSRCALIANIDFSIISTKDNIRYAEAYLYR